MDNAEAKQIERVQQDYHSAVTRVEMLSTSIAQKRSGLVALIETVHSTEIKEALKVAVNTGEFDVGKFKGLLSQISKEVEEIDAEVLDIIEKEKT